MKGALSAAVLVLALVAVPAQATVVNFDDLVGSTLVPDGYGGITWDSNWIYYGDAQDPYNPQSAPNRVYQNYDKWGNDGSVVNDIPFYFTSPVFFDGAYFSGPSGNPVTFQLYLGGLLQWTSTSLDPSGVPSFLASGYSGAVDEVRVSSNLFRVMDDVTFHAVPEPGSLLLVGAGLLALGALRRRVS